MSGRIAEAREMAERFALGDRVESVEPLGRGLINDTFLVTAGREGWVLQRINGDVFPQPERIMGNLSALSAHLGGDPSLDLQIPALIRTTDGNSFCRGADGGLWRLMEFVAGAHTLDRLESEAQAREVGRALGVFHRLVSDLPLERLAVTLPGFHETPAYVARFFEVLGRDARMARSAEIQHLAEFAAARRGACTNVLEEARRSARIPRRVIHGDPKLDNILFDATGARAIGLIDLDTVQPGLVHYDIGDCLRSSCKRRGTSPGGVSGAAFDLGLCRAVLGAYADQTRGFITPAEIALVYDGIRLIPFELGLRFLTDHLEGNRYFRVRWPGENLEKAQIQFALLEDIERKQRGIVAIIAKSFRRAGDVQGGRMEPKVRENR